jgi:pyridoxine/pyridoxamine 5'-phosphate oxidase
MLTVHGLRLLWHAACCRRRTWREQQQQAAHPQSQQLMQSGSSAPRGAGWWAGVVLATLAAGAFTGVVLGPHYIWVGLVSVPLVVGEWLARIRRIVLVLAGLEAGDAPARLQKEEMPSDPYDLLRRWMQEAEAQDGYAAARAMVLATSSPSEGPTARTVLCQECGAGVGGLVVGTNSRSLKSRQLLDEPRVEAVFRWGDRQVRVRGEARLGSAAESDAAWGRLDRGQQLGLSLLQQGQPCDEPRHSAIGRAWQALAAKHGASASGSGGAGEGEGVTAIPRADHFTALLIAPTSFEFYLGGQPGYINDRFLYCRRAVGGATGGDRFELVGRLQA